MKSPNQEIALQRDCDAIQIPSGNPIVLPAGMHVVLTQTLGGSFTVATEAGLVRIAEQDADALGIEKDTPKPASQISKSEKSLPTEDAVWNQLKTVYDPEIPVNIVDLGLIYDCEINKTDAGQTHVQVKMTLTAPGCGMGPVIAADARSKILMIDGVDEANVELVWDPPWNQSMITEAGRMKLGLV